MGRGRLVIPLSIVLTSTLGRCGNVYRRHCCNHAPRHPYESVCCLWKVSRPGPPAGRLHSELCELVSRRLALSCDGGRARYLTARERPGCGLLGQRRSYIGPNTEGITVAAAADW